MGAPHAGFIVMLLPAIAVVFVARDGGVVVVPVAAVGVVNMMVAVGTAVDVRPGENSKHDKKIIPQFKVYPKKRFNPGPRQENGVSYLIVSLFFPLHAGSNISYVIKIFPSTSDPNFIEAI